jgi:hypothetical protein
MTTQAEPQQPPAQTYPTSPPWATAPAAPVEPPPHAESPYAPAVGEYGRLLVPYPEEMQNASRPTPPSWWPIAPLTFLFLIPGLVVTARRATRARRGRNSQVAYWVTFVVSLAVSFVVWDLIVAVGLPVYLNYRETAITTTVQEHIVKDGQLTTKSRLTATSATCNPTGPRGDDDQRTYSCLLKLDDGRTGTIDVSAGLDGNWTAVEKTAVPSTKTTKTK